MAVGAETAAPEVLEGREPATGRPLPPVPTVDREEVFTRVALAREAQRRWAALRWAERRRRLLAFRRILVANADEMAATIVRETGKPHFEALSHEIFPLADLTSYFAKRAERILADERIPLHLFGLLKRSHLEYEPRGVIGVISPWNYPLAIPMGEVIMGLAARNAVAVKPSEWTPRTLLLAKAMLEDAGIEPALVPVLPGTGEVGQALIEAGIDMMVFTGSVATGRKVGAACGERLIPFVAELGGKDAAVVLPDAKIEDAARQVVWGAFANAGQVCASVERVLVHESILEPFVQEVVAQTRALRQGAPASPEEPVDVGAMVLPSQVELVERQVQEAVRGGARVLTGGSAREVQGGRFFEPTVLVDVRPEMSIWREETFGPCMSIRPFRSEEEAVREVNGSPFGLSAYVFSGSVARASRLASLLDVGTVMVNDVLYTHSLPEAPWGGTKHSGIGRVHGKQGLRELCSIRHVNRPRFDFLPLWMFPYRYSRHQLIQRALRLLFR